MQSDYQIQNAARAIITFTDSYAQNKQGKQNKQSDSEPTPSLVEISAYLYYLRDQIWDNIACKSVTQIPTLLRSLSALVTFRLGNRIDLDVDNQRLEIRIWSRDCLSLIQEYGDEQNQTELINNGYGRVMSITFSTAGGIGEEQDQEIFYGLNCIYWFLKDLYQGRNNDYKPSFQPLPLLARNTEEQMEEEGANEEIEAQMKNNGNNGKILDYANYAKATILNLFIRRR
ncbi:MAG: hypothetical protein EZS28_001207 [Streblomastix strix]|uniref:Uncharacterized protein n=1 Tax=Streblomastix strix TaxID=222440 RepID=A0A5J4X7W9_9EUKA|nr:MAG: hypothetical protein EZS28_001207 [Streblomastix strix]